MNPIKVIIIGAGSRGNTYASYAESFPDEMQVVGVAEPRPFYRNRLQEIHHIPDEYCVDSWGKLTDINKFADAVVIATPDAHHTKPTLAFANLGYHILLEKPMAPSEKECNQIYHAVKVNDIHFAVCHVLRYTPYTQMLKSILDSGEIGKIVNIQRIEPVGYWHQAHSFVRGNWGNTARSTFMLMAKSCHDVDWLSYIIGEKCTATSSFGNLFHFKASEKPDTAGERCVACDYEPECPYSAKKIYFNFLDEGNTDWPINILSADTSRAGIQKALEEGPYGLCVYGIDNDVVDHQIVNYQFAGGQTASLTMTAFNAAGTRKTHIFGTHGEIYGDGKTFKITNFLTDEIREVDTEKNLDELSGHSGGDFAIMQSFLQAIIHDNASYIKSGIDETIESHMMVFAAEKARLNNTVETIPTVGDTHTSLEKN